MTEKVAYAHSWLMERRTFSLMIVLVFVILSIAAFFYAIDIMRPTPGTDPSIDILIITDKKGTLWTAYPPRPESLGQLIDFHLV